MTNITEFNTVPCPKINALDVDAFLGLSLDPLSPTTLNLESSWGVTGLDLTPAIKAGETITHLFLTPSENPNALQFNREDYGVAGAPANGIDCITGVELGSIIPMGALKDVDSTMAMMDGGVYMYDQSITRFQPFNLQSFIDNTNDTLQALTGATGGTAGNLLGLQSQVTNLDNRVTNLEQGSGLTPEEKAKLDSLVTITAIGDNLTLTDGTLSATGGGGITSIKTVNNQSLVGTGNVNIPLFPSYVKAYTGSTVDRQTISSGSPITLLTQTVSAGTYLVLSSAGVGASTSSVDFVTRYATSGFTSWTVLGKTAVPSYSTFSSTTYDTLSHVAILTATTATDIGIVLRMNVSQTATVNAMSPTLITMKLG